MSTPLDESSLRIGLDFLCAVDTDLATICDEFGPPPLSARPPGFPTLIHIILEQQVSITSARATFDRLLARTQVLTPQSLLAIDDATMRAIGFSRQKTLYARHLALAIHEQRVDLDALADQDEAAVRSALLALKGIGPWTVDNYLLMALLWPDVWPAGDLALQIAMQGVKRLSTRPGVEEMQSLAEPWRPWRAIAARLLWHYYLSQPRPRKKGDGGTRREGDNDK